jgi:hypothetical protein
MILSKELNAQVARFGKTRSCSLTSELKNELAIILFEIKGIRLNKSCGTCIRNAMQDVINFMQNELRMETFIGVRHDRANNTGDMTIPDREEMAKENKQAAELLEQLDAMSYADLKKYAGVKGNIKRTKIYELIHLSSK